MTIDEMALKVFPVNKMAGIGCSYDLNQQKREGYILGANAVLEEIEKYMDMQDGCYALECIQMRINELKGSEK